MPGQPIPENNFNTLDFLAYGGYASFTGVQAGVLKPWPSNIPAPQRVCATPTIQGAPYSVATGTSINLSGSVTANASTPLQLSWTAGTAAAGTNLNGALTNATTSTPTFNAAGLAAGTYFLTFSTFNICGVASAATTITVVAAAPPPTINPISTQLVNVNTPVTIIASSNSLPAPTFAWTQTGGPVNPIPGFTTAVVAPTPPATAASRATFTPATAGTYTFSVTATNGGGTSNPVTVTITVNPAVTTNIVVTPAEYRIGKQRLVLTATTSDLVATSMVLQPYKLDNGTTFNPSGATFTNTGAGIWTLTLVGVPPPACRNNPAQYVTPCTQTPLLVTSTSPAGNGTSPFTAIDRIRA